MNSSAYQYDAFISYRRQDPDKQFARDLRKSLIAAGYKVAFDEVDFSPQASFLEEMERCVKQSRFVLAVISSRYFESGNTQEEAIITKVMDMGERKRRLIPLIVEPVERPVWLYNLVGLDFTDEDPIVPPFDKLKTSLGSPSTEKIDSANPLPHPRLQQASTDEAETADTKPLAGNLQKRLKLTRQLSALPGPQFEQIVFALSPPPGIIAASSAPLGDRVATLLAWAEGKEVCGLDTLEAVFNEVVKPRNP
ncbi:MAG: toll/interleukin-1 receptor domain-containing protein [Cyanobacteria bacterium P01_F01_bin.86]